MTNLSGKVKAAGKTTWIMRMVAAALDGQPFMGEPTSKTPVVYLTEQPTASFVEALKSAGLLERQDLSVLPWNKAIGCSWPEVVRAAIEECKRLGAKLLVVDTLHQFAQLTGDAENNSGDALGAVQPLQIAMAAGLSVLLVIHDRKSGGDVGDSGRGSSAFAGAADILISLRRLEGKSRPTLRELRTLSRFSETPQEMIIEFTAAGYIVREARDVTTVEAETAILSAAPGSEAAAMTTEELAEASDVTRPTAQRAMNILIDRGQLKRIGKGVRGNAFRYFLPESDSAQAPSSKGQKETRANDGDDPAERTVHLATDAIECCPWCGESEWSSLPGTARTCRVCNPGPLETGEGATNESSKSWIRTSPTNGLGV